MSKQKKSQMMPWLWLIVGASVGLVVVLVLMYVTALAIDSSQLGARTRQSPLTPGSGLLSTPTLPPENYDPFAPAEPDFFNIYIPSINEIQFRGIWRDDPTPSAVPEGPYYQYYWDDPIL